MLDVHPPHSPTHTWKDFFIHIATIVVGLLIAVGLEQTVEYFHRRHQVKELRQALSEEREENRKIFIVNAAQFHLNSAILENDLHIFEYLRKHPGTPEEKLPGVPNWSIPYDPAVTSAWRNAQQTQTLALLPREENEDDARFYDLLDKSEQAAAQAAVSAFQVGDYAFADPNPSHLTPAEVETTTKSIQNLMYTNWIWGVWLSNLGRDREGFSKTLSKREVDLVNPTFRSAQDEAKLAEATALTSQALAASKAALDEAKRTYDDH